MPPWRATLAAVAALTAALLPGLGEAALLGRRAPRKFTVDLALPPERRWEEVIIAYRDLLPPILTQLEQRINAVSVQLAREQEERERSKGRKAQEAKEASEEERTEAEEAAAAREEELAEVLARRHWDQAWWLRRHHIEAEHLAELAGIARLAQHPDVTLDRLIAWQMTQDLHLLPQSSPPNTARALQSLGILAAGPNGTVYLGQNLDMNFFFVAGGKRMSLEDIVLELTFVHGGTPLFTALSFPGRIGACTGMTLNPDPSSRWSVQCLAGGSTRTTAEHQKLNASRPVELTVRSALAARLDFAGACQRLRATEGDNMYHVAGGGPWEGAVINTVMAIKWWTISQDLDEHVGKWFTASSAMKIFYRWRPLAPKTDPLTVMSRRLHELGQENVSLTSLFSLLREPASMNKGTILSWLSVPSTGISRTFFAKEPLLQLGL